MDSKGNLVQKFKKKGAGAFANWLTDADNYYIDFNKDMNWKQRALLTGSLLMVDFMLFSQVK